jgi:hypothetical protein
MGLAGEEMALIWFLLCYGSKDIKKVEKKTKKAANPSSPSEARRCRWRNP